MMNDIRKLLEAVDEADTPRPNIAEFMYSGKATGRKIGGYTFLHHLGTSRWSTGVEWAEYKIEHDFPGVEFYHKLECKRGEGNAEHRVEVASDLFHVQFDDSNILYSYQNGKHVWRLIVYAEHESFSQSMYKYEMQTSDVDYAKSLTLALTGAEDDMIDRLGFSIIVD